MWFVTGSHSLHSLGIVWSVSQDQGWVWTLSPFSGRVGGGDANTPSQPVTTSFLRGDGFVCIDGTWQNKILNIELTSQEFIPWKGSCLVKKWFQEGCWWKSTLFSHHFLVEIHGSPWSCGHVRHISPWNACSTSAGSGLTTGGATISSWKPGNTQLLRLLLDQPVNLVPQAGWQPPLTSGWWWESWGFGETRGAQVDNSGRSGLHVAWGIPDFAEMLKKHCCERWRV